MNALIGTSFVNPFHNISQTTVDSDATGAIFRTGDPT